VSGPLLSVRDLRVSFDTPDGTVQAVNGLSYDLHAGQALGVVGESGSGKSVSFQAILGLTRGRRTVHVSGSAKFEGTELIGASESQLRRLRGASIGMVFQDPLASLHPFFRVERQLVEAIRVHRDSIRHGAARSLALEALDWVGLPDPLRALRAYPHELSGGMRQRVMIAMALINRPQLIIADEPTTALDVTVQARILGLLDRLRRETGAAIVLVTHDLGIVAQTTDRTAVMYAGRIVEQASTRSLFREPEHPYTWGLLRSMPRIDGPEGELIPIPGSPPSLLMVPSGCAFHPRCAYADGPEHRSVVPALRAAGEPDHTVACLLEPAKRRRLRAEFVAGTAAAPSARGVGDTGHVPR
jgi:peptide/nickel transport system ATP-binding protein